MSSYVPLFLALVKRKGYSCEISDPQLVNASATPPPSRRYPGLICYMVTITVDKLEYHGYGPTAGLARQFAAFEAYKALAPLLKKDGMKCVQDSGIDCTQDDDSATEWRTLDDDAFSVCSEPVMNVCNTHSLSESADEGSDSSYQEEGYRQDPLANQESNEASNNLNDEKASQKLFPEGDKPANSVASHERLNGIGPNPVGQLQEIFLKEFKRLPVFAESVKVSGSNTEFICTVEVNNLSARGIGQSKKLARRHAAENMLTLMIDKGININPSRKQRGMKKSNPPRKGRSDQRHHAPVQQSYGQPCSNSRFTRYNSFPKDICNGPHHARPIHPTNHQRFPRINRGPGLLPLPFLPPLRVPTADIVYKNVTDSDSDADCENSNTVSTGLCEVLPPDLQSNDVKKTRQPSSSSLSVEGEYPQSAVSATASLGRTHSTSGCDAHQSIPAESSPNTHFSEKSSLFVAHSDPCQFTIRPPCLSRKHWSPPIGASGATLHKKLPPWKEIRRDSQVVSPSTDYIYRKVSAPSRHQRLATETSMGTAPPPKDLIPQQVSIATDVQSSSLPVHPLFLSTPMVQYPAHLHSVIQSREGDNSRHVVQPGVMDRVSNDPHDDRGSSSSEGDSVVLTNDISVGLPSEGSVSTSLITLW